MTTIINLGGKDYEASPLNLAALKRLLPKIQSVKMNAPLTAEVIDIVSEVVQASLSRKHPDVTLDTVQDGLDTANFREVFKSILSASGLAAKPEGAPPGEASPST